MPSATAAAGIDLTREQTFSLSSLTLNQLESLDRPLTFHLVYGRGTRSLRQLDRVASSWSSTVAADPAMIKLESLNPYTELARAEDLAKRVPDLAVLQGGGVLIESGEGTDAEFVVVPGQEMFEPVAAGRAPDSADRFESVFKGEDAITSALIRLREGKKSKVAFTTGHGEPLDSDLNPRGPGIGIWRARLASVGCETIELNLLKDAIPDDLALLVIAGPKNPFKPEEVAKLKAYAERGRPRPGPGRQHRAPGLDDFLKSFNLEIGRGLVIDPRLNYRRNLQLVFAFLKGGARASDHRLPAGRPGGPRPQRSTDSHPGPGGSRRARPQPPVNAQPRSDRDPPHRPAVVGRDRPQAIAAPELDKEADEPGPDHRRRGRPGASAARPRVANRPPAKPRLVLFSSRPLAETSSRASSRPTSTW